MTLRMNLGRDSYDIVVERGLLQKAHEHLSLDRRVLVVTDEGVPARYAQLLAEQCGEAVVVTVPAGESSKSLTTLERLLATMLDRGFSRKDCVVAVGGGVVGDLAGFAASVYMRGLSFYNLPTTLLSQIDSSIGGKTAVNFGGVKNVVGSFYQPQKVLIDPDLLSTLPPRQLANGLAEAVKMALTSDRDLFELLERETIEKHMETVILRSLQVKQRVVEQDEKEAGLRRVLNFGHTVGHGIESTTELYHGESVALGMLPLCAEGIRPRVEALLQKYGLEKRVPLDWEKIARVLLHDKKADGDCVTVIEVDRIGSFTMKTVNCRELIEQAKSVLGGIRQ